MLSIEVAMARLRGLVLFSYMTRGNSSDRSTHSVGITGKGARYPQRFFTIVMRETGSDEKLIGASLQTKVPGGFHP